MSVIPENRQYKICFKDIDCDDTELEFSREIVEIEMENAKPLSAENPRNRVIHIMSRWQDSTRKKNAAYKAFSNLTDRNSLFRALYKARLPKPVFDCIYEALSEN